MRKTAIVGLALAALVGSSSLVGTAARATEPSGRQDKDGMARLEASKRTPEFNSYWFVYGVPPYKDGIAPWERSKARHDPRGSQDPPEFDPHWFVYGVPPYKGGVAPWKRSQPEPVTPSEQDQAR